MEHAIEVQHFTKAYGDKTVIHDLGFSVRKGQIFGLLGLNGAGKTTTLECMEGLRDYQQGSITLHGRIGVQLQTSSLPNHATVKELLTLFSKWNHTALSEEQIKQLDISKLFSVKYQALSTGQKRRVHLAFALLGDPDIIFLDEPTAGLDVDGRVAIHKIMKELKSSGKTIILASHDMAEVEELCDHIAILKDGMFIFEGTPKEFTHLASSNIFIFIKANMLFHEQSFTLSSFKEMKQQYMVFETSKLSDALMELLSHAKANEIELLDISIERPSLEDRFIALSKED